MNITESMSPENCVCGRSASSVQVPNSEQCRCQCEQTTPSFRDDNLQCVNNLSGNIYFKIRENCFLVSIIKYHIF